MTCQLSLNEGSGNIPPPRNTTTCGDPICEHAQRREREYSPSKAAVVQTRAIHLASRSTKGAGIFPLQEPGWLRTRITAARSTKGAGIFPLQVRRSGVSGVSGGPAQRREREYSPSKCTTTTTVASRPGSLNEGSGNIPPPRSRSVAGADTGRGAAQRREREYSPSKVLPRPVRCGPGSLNEGSGNIPPPSRLSATLTRVVWTLNEGSGNIPPPSRPAT